MGRGKSQLRKCPQQTGIGARLWGIFFIDDCCGRAPPLVDADAPGHLVLGYVRKQAEQARRKEFVSDVSSGPLLPFLLQVPGPPSRSDGLGCRHLISALPKLLLIFQSQQQVL